MELSTLTQKLLRISDTYAKRFGIDRTPDWYIMKIQEELGELMAAHLKSTARARVKPTDDHTQNVRDELADVLAMTLLFAHNQGIDVEEAVRTKWFKYLEDDDAK